MITKATKTYRNLTGQNIGPNSQMRLFNVLTDHDRYTKFMNIFKQFTYNKDVQKNTSFYITYRIGNDEWWDNISTKFYETPFLWWALASYNNVVNPFEALEPGTDIKILKSKYIYSLLRDMEEMARM